MNTSAFRRLAGVTQVVSAAEGHVFHNRLTHSLEVAQIGRRIAERLLDKQESVAAMVGGIDPEVVEGAALAHDLGHPPFGHIAEQELDSLVIAADVSDGFEGNPQTFRVVTRLSVRSIDFLGLNLTRASHDALLKYPWPRDLSSLVKKRKWGYYSSEQDVFDWTRSRNKDDERKCVEAELMDWADDIAYAVHDMEDFYRAGMVPLNRLRSDDERAEFVSEVFGEWRKAGARLPFSEADAADRLKVLSFTPVNGPYAGTREQRAAIRTLTSGLIGRYVRGIGLRVPNGPDEGHVHIDQELLAEVLILKELTWHYVIRNPALAAQQYGQREVIRELFQTFHKAASARPDDKDVGWMRRVLPRGFADALAEREANGTAGPDAHVRVAADAVASLTEQQALDIHRRLTGHDPKSVLDPIVR